MLFVIVHTQQTIKSCLLVRYCLVGSLVCLRRSYRCAVRAGGCLARIDRTRLGFRGIARDARLRISLARLAHAFSQRVFILEVPCLAILPIALLLILRCGGCAAASIGSPARVLVSAFLASALRSLQLHGCKARSRNNLAQGHIRISAE